tara:strand:+ start:587 stop:823 length:237 start_codon:yes stop_codon:yes gene_type:complete
MFHTYQDELQDFMSSVSILETKKYLGHQIHKINKTRTFVNGKKVNRFIITGPKCELFVFWMDINSWSEAKSLLKSRLK